LPGMGTPFSPRGVWQSPHMPTPSTMYFPRANFADCAGDAEEDRAEVITTMESMAKATAQAIRFDFTELFMVSLEAERILHWVT